MNFSAASRGYANLWTLAKVRPERVAAAREIAGRLTRNRSRYGYVARPIGCPWWFVAIIHNLESGGDFRTHLHNGDPLMARTVHVPAGRPVHGEPPYSWEASAMDALTLKDLDKVPSWELPRCLYEWERYNGWGYLGKINSPYLWSFTTLYDRGKYIADHVFDPAVVSSQCGAAAILKALIDIGAVTIDKETDVMTDLQLLLKQFIGVAPGVVALAAGPAAGMAVKALAEALELDPKAPAAEVRAKLDGAPLSAAIQAIARAETAVQGLTTPVTPVAGPPMRPGPIDELIGGRTFTGWKTILGGGLFVLVSILEVLGLAPGILTPEILAAAKWAAGLLAGVGVIAKIERWIAVLKQPMSSASRITAPERP